jgi:hypothetical protein
MNEILDMFRGHLAPEAVLAACNVATSAPDTRAYVHFYVGVYQELHGARDRAAERLQAYAQSSLPACFRYYCEPRSWPYVTGCWVWLCIPC